MLRTSAGRRGVRGGDAVLHLHLRDIEIGAEVEGDRDREAPVGGRVRGHVEHVLDAVDLLLDRRHHGRGHHVRAGARILAGHVDDRRRDLGILRDRQPEERHRAQDHEHDRDHGGKDRPVDEEVRDAHRAPSLRLSSSLSPPCALRLLLRRDLGARPRAHQAVDDDAVLGLEAVLDRRAGCRRAAPSVT